MNKPIQEMTESEARELANLEAEKPDGECDYDYYVSLLEHADSLKGDNDENLR